MQRLSRMTRTEHTTVCLWCVASLRACVATITNLLRVWLILESLLAPNSLVFRSTPALHSGVPDAELFKKSSAWTSLVRLNLQLDPDVAVYIQATHGCCENRGIMAHSSLTQTTVLRGAFKTDQSVKKEFFDNIKLQQDFAPR
jgi:hypothetical protein